MSWYPADASNPCIWEGCPARLPKTQLGCKKHWFKLPLVLRRRIMRNYKPDKPLTPEYVEAVRAARKWIAEQQAARQVPQSEAV